MSRTDRFLRLFTDVRAGEAATALLLAANVFVILTAYYIIKVVREPLILAGGGAEVKSYSAAAQALLLLVAVPAYGALASRLDRRRLITMVTLFFVACLAVFFVLARAGAPVGVPFYLWVGIFNLMVVAQFWAFANDLYTTEEGKRLFPIVGFGASAGAVFGSWLAGALIGPLGLYAPLLLAGALLLGTLVLTAATDARERRRREAQHAVPEAGPAATGEFRAVTGQLKPPDQDYRTASGERLRPIKLGPDGRLIEPKPSPAGAFQLVLGNRYLLLIALMMMVLNWVNTTGEYILSRAVTQDAQALVARGGGGGRSEGEVIGAFYSSFFSGVNLVGLLLQLFVVSRLLKWFGVRAALLVLPCIALLGYGILAFLPLLPVVRAAKTAENATDYSLQNTVRNVLFLPTTREQKYKAKQAIDGFFVRAGDLLQAGLVFVGTSMLALQSSQFALVNMALVVVWLALAVAVGRRYERLAAETA